MSTNTSYIKYINRYLGATFLYGFTRQFIRTNNAVIVKKDNNDRELLYSERFYLCFMSGLYGFVLFPKFLNKDINKLEVYMRGLNISDYYNNKEMSFDECIFN